MRNHRWAIVFGALLLAAAVGFAAFQAGTAHGISVSGKLATPEAGAHPYPYPYYGWHGPWGFGFLFVPLVFFAFWFLLVRGLFWRRRGYYGGCGPYGRGPGWRHEGGRHDGAGDAAPGETGTP